MVRTVGLAPAVADRALRVRRRGARRPRRARVDGDGMASARRIRFAGEWRRAGEQAPRADLVEPGVRGGAAGVALRGFPVTGAVQLGLDGQAAVVGARGCDVSADLRLGRWQDVLADGERADII